MGETVLLGRMCRQRLAFDGRRQRSVCVRVRSVPLPHGMRACRESGGGGTRIVDLRAFAVSCPARGCFDQKSLFGRPKGEDREETLQRQRSKRRDLQQTIERDSQKENIKRGRKNDGICRRFCRCISKANDAVQAEIGGAEPGSYYSCLALCDGSQFTYPRPEED